MEKKKALQSLSHAGGIRKFLNVQLIHLLPEFTPVIPQKLSIQHAFPKFFELEQKYGSLA